MCIVKVLTGRIIIIPLLGDIIIYLCIHLQHACSVQIVHRNILNIFDMIVITKALPSKSF
jgi:hypothetical protein